MQISEVASYLKQGIHRDIYESIRNLPIEDGELTVGKYIEALEEIGMVKQFKETYILKNLEFGITSIEGVPPHIIDPEFHAPFPRCFESLVYG